MRIDIEISLQQIVRASYYAPNGREYICKLCQHIEVDRQRIEAHVKDHKIGELA